MNKLLDLLHVHFIPSHKNGFKPHFLRLKIAAGVLGLVLALEVLYIAGTVYILPHSDYFAAIFASALIDQTNQNRVIENLGSLIPNAKLEQAAQLKANDMAAKGYFSHNSPDGKTPWYWFQQAGYDYAAAGENLAVNFTDSTDVTEAWMHSPLHRANILNGNYTEIGIATAKGVYKGKDAIFVVQEFGRPSMIARQLSIVSGTTKSIEEMIVAPKVTTPAPKPAVNPPVKPQIKPTPKPIPPATNIPATTLIAKATATPTSAQEASSTIIAGADTQKIDIPVYPVESPILETSRVSKLEMLLASPRQATTGIYLILAALVLFALGLAIFIKVRVQYPHIIANGILLVAIILSLVLLNEALGFTQGIV